MKSIIPDGVVVVGAGGSIGRLLAEKLADEPDLEVLGLDLAAPVPGAARAQRLVMRQEDILRPTEATLAALGRARLVVLALSQQVTEQALPRVLPYLAPDCVLVETLSIKARVSSQLTELRVRQQTIGINPMFAGDLAPQGRPVAAVVYRGGAQALDFLARLERWGLKVVALSPEEHDRTMALFQSLGHALVLSFGKTLGKAALSPAAINALAPPPFRVLFSLLARMTQVHPDVYWEIQADNPHAQDVRASLRASLEQLEQTISTGARETFQRDLEAMKATLVDPNDSFVNTSRRIFELINV